MLLTVYKMNKIKLSLPLFIGISLLFLYSCKTEEQATTIIEPLDSTNIYNDGDILYALPRTKLHFTLKLTRTVSIPGPYHQYGEQLLGLSSIPHKRQTDWDISDIHISGFNDIDYDQLYKIQPEGDFSVSQHNFTKKGWILPLTNEIQPLAGNDFVPRNKAIKGIIYKDLSVRKFVGEETKTVYKSVWKDSLYAKVPVKKTTMVKKSGKEKAQEAANFIFMIREKRFELLSGMADFYPEGEALQTSIEELNRLENTYLSLFSGKQFTDTIQYTLYMNPSIKDTQEANILFRFSEKQGVLDSDKNGGIPVWIEFEKLDNTERLRKFFSKERVSGKADDFYYRFPCHTLIKLKFGEELISKRFLDVFQFGPVIKIPYKFLNEQQIIHYPPEQQ